MELIPYEDLPSVRIDGGIDRRTLWDTPGTPRLLVLDWAPGSRWPGDDVHEPGPEIVFVMSGALIDGDVELRPGDLAHYPAGSSHSPRSETGCRLLVFYPEG